MNTYIIQRILDKFNAGENIAGDVQTYLRLRFANHNGDAFIVQYDNDKTLYVWYGSYPVVMRAHASLCNNKYDALKMLLMKDVESFHRMCDIYFSKYNQCMNRLPQYYLETPITYIHRTNMENATFECTAQWTFSNEVYFTSAISTFYCLFAEIDAMERMLNLIEKKRNEIFNSKKEKVNVFI